MKHLVLNACYETLEQYCILYHSEGGADLLYDLKNFIMGTWETKKFIVMNDRHFIIVNNG